MEKSSNINELRVSRIKELIKREGIKQIDLADELDMEPQNLSRCLKKGKVSEKTCHRIHEHYPEYRVEWLMGYDDAMTDYEWADNVQSKKDRIATGIWGLFENALNKKQLSLHFVHRTGEHPDSSSRFQSDCYYSVIDKEGNEKKHLTAIEMAELEQKIQEYCDFIAEKYLE